VKVAFDEESIGKHLFAQKKGAIKWIKECIWSGDFQNRTNGVS
jgi:hypothetical protein